MAEVLITLGIIGVVAAITMPTLISNYKKAKLVNQLKSEIALLENAVKMAEVKHGDIEEWERCEAPTEECTKFYFENYLAPELKIVKTCIPASSECYEQKSLSEKTDSNNDWQISAVLSNGSSIKTWAGTTATQGESNHMHIYFDIDGPKKGKNTLGVDIFDLVVVLENGNSQKKGMHLWGFHKKNLDYSQLREDSLYGCSKNANSGAAGISCGALIQAEGWKIPDDYPVRF